MSLLKVENLSLSIYGTSILRRVSFSVTSGKILALIGESGSGKSMTAYSILKLLPKGSEIDGDITLVGKDIIAANEAEMCDLRGDEVGIIFQEPMTALNPVQTIGAQVAEAILVHTKVSKAEAFRRARETLNRVELPEDRFPLSRYPHELSGGQRQRVVIAMAIALQPKLLIADEPTTALDVTTQAEILTLLKRLVAEDGMGMILITHDLAVVSEVADDIVIMKSGEIVETGQPNHLFAQMKHPYTKALFSASGHVPDRGKSTISPDALLQVKSVSRDYALPRKNLFGPVEFFRAVNNVSFEIKRGESVGLVGESGCGKSTLTRAILGLEQVQAGEILLDGASVYAGRKPNIDVRRKMQVVFQDPYSSFNPRHRVDRLITEPFHLMETSPTAAARQDAIAQALESVGLTYEDADKYIHEFSGGQRQRIAIARALIIKPELIILDEAVSALDVAIRAQILDLLAELSDRFGLSYLFISHDLSVVRSITDRVLVMKSGEIVEQGDTKTVFDTPKHDYTKTLIAAVPKLPHVNAA